MDSFRCFEYHSIKMFISSDSPEKTSSVNPGKTSSVNSDKTEIKKQRLELLEKLQG